MMKFSFPGPLNQVSLHTHSKMSDGRDTLEEMCLAGKKSGVREFGVSDHLVIHPYSDQSSWSMDPNQLDQYVETLLNLKKKLNDDHFTIRIGLEVDFFYETHDAVQKKLKQYPLDYQIAGIHFATNDFAVDGTPEPWKKLSPEENDAICRAYWKKAEDAAATGCFSFMAHLDLPKKFGFAPQKKYLPQIIRVLDILQKNGTAMEVNTAGLFMPCKEQYPSLTILTEAFKRRIPVLISADAHCADIVTRGFDQATAVLREAGYPV